MKSRLLLLLPFLFLLLIPSASSASGTVQAELLRTERANCKKATNPKACFRNASARAKRKLNKLQAGEGLYGFGLPQKFIPRQPGKLLWSKPLARVDGAGRTYFVLYSSLLPDGKPSVVSGTLSLPTGKAPRAGWPLISWAHGTTGLADICAPSRGVDGSYGEAGTFVSSWLRQGYAVVGSDYQGLGTPGPHPYLVGLSEGRSVLDAVLASRTFANIKRTVIMGHSQGGHAAIWATSLLPSYSAIGAARNVSYAPPSLLSAQADLISSQPEDAYGVSALALSILRGAEVASPDIDPAEILSEEALALYPRVDEVCLGTLGGEAEAAGLSPSKLLLPGWKGSASGQKFYGELEQTNPALTVPGKLLLLQGLEDTTVRSLFTDVLAGDLHSLNPGRISYMRWSNKVAPPSGIAENYLIDTPSTHSSILGDSFQEVSAWLKK